ncbi:MAG: hypothetical protein ACI9CA_001594 [Natronomonas sp.]|jgi:hypothetical protein
MSGEDRHTATMHDDGIPAATPRLLRRLQDAGRDETPEEVMAAVTGDTVDADVAFDEELVTCSLDELLLSLVALRDDGTHGTGLIDDLGALFGVEPSPGTVYPRLHSLEADGLLSRHELVRTKQHAIDDRATACERVESAMHQHLALGLFLAAALETV